MYGGSYLTWLGTSSNITYTSLQRSLSSIEIEILVFQRSFAWEFEHTTIQATCDCNHNTSYETHTFLHLMFSFETRCLNISFHLCSVHC